MEQEENTRQLEVLEALKTRPELIKSFYVVGLWIWAEFPTRPDTETLAFLKSLGFKWNPKRKAWQNACGVRRFASAKDPRGKYQIVRFED